MPERGAPEEDRVAGTAGEARGQLEAAARGRRLAGPQQRVAAGEQQRPGVGRRLQRALELRRRLLVGEHRQRLLTGAPQVIRGAVVGRLAQVMRDLGEVALLPTRDQGGGGRAVQAGAA